MREFGRVAASLVLVALLVAGCADTGGNKAAATPPQNVRILERGAEVDIPVPVILLGFPTDVVEALKAAVANPGPVKSSWHESRYDHPNQVPEPTEEQLRAGYTLFPKYSFLLPSKDVEQAFFAMTSEAVVSEAAVPNSLVMYDGNAVEDWLWTNFQGLPGGPSPDTPGVVLIHGTGQLADSHAYRYTLNNGYMDRVRAFGERNPQLIFDISADSRSFLPIPLAIDGDPTSGAAAPFDSPIKGVGNDDAELLAQLLDAMAHYRIMQGPGFPPTTEPCIAVTVIHAIEIGSVLDLLPTERRQNRLVDQAKLNESFMALLSPLPVYTDVKVLVLPDDDPQLHDAIKNGPLRLYLDQNWDKYWVDHDRCEAYLSLFFQPVDGSPAGGGVAYYSTQDDRYFSSTTLGELHRAQYGQADPSYGQWDWANDVVAHETGHLLSVRHPFDITDENGPFDGYLNSFSTIWSTMSYAPENKITTQFSAMDRNNLHRNRVAFQLMELQELGLADGEDFDAGVDAMSRYDWAAAETSFGRLLESSR